MQLIYNQLSQMGLTYDQISVLQDKDGITVARVFSGTDSYILNLFRIRNIAVKLRPTICYNLLESQL